MNIKIQQRQHLIWLCCIKKTSQGDLAQKWTETAENDLYDGKSVSGLNPDTQGPKIDDFIASLVDDPVTLKVIKKDQAIFAEHEMKLERS